MSVVAVAKITGVDILGSGATTSASDLTSGTLAAGRLPAFTGDVTTSAGSAATTIAAAAVTLAKQANLAANSIQGNNTGSAATPLALTVAQTKSLLAIASSDVSGLATSATTDTTSATNITSGSLPDARLSANVPIIPTVAYAARSTGSGTGARKFITDLGIAGAEMIWDGTYWRFAAPTGVSVNITPVAGLVQTAEQILMQATLPAGLLRSGRYFRILTLFSKNGTTNIVTAQLRLGTAGTTADASLVSSASLSAPSRSYTMQTVFAPTSATNITALGGMAKTTGLNGSGTASTSTFPQDVTVPNIDSSVLILSASVSMDGTTNTPTVGYMIVEIVP